MVASIVDKAGKQRLNIFLITFNFHEMSWEILGGYTCFCHFFELISLPFSRCSRASQGFRVGWKQLYKSNLFHES